MTIPHRTKAWATGALVLAAVSACSRGTSDPADPTTSPAVTASSPTAPETSASPTSPTDAATSSATQTVGSYVSTIDEIAQRSADLKMLNKVTTGSELTAERRFLKHQRSRGERQVGSTRISQLKVQSVNLDNSAPAAGKVPTVVVDVCWDVSKVDVLDKSGKSIVSASRPDMGWTRYTVANYHYAADPSGGWRVASGQDLEQSPCAAS